MLAEEQRIARNLRALINASGLTQVEIGEVSGIHAGNINSWVNCRCGAQSTGLLRLCDAMGWRFDYVIGVGEAPNAVRGKDFGGRLANLLIKNGETNAALADAVGVERSTVSSWVLGEYLPSSGNLARICIHYGVSPERMLQGQIRTGRRGNA